LSRKPIEKTNLLKRQISSTGQPIIQKSEEKIEKKEGKEYL
jgi:hypothetical protein